MRRRIRRSWFECHCLYRIVQHENDMRSKTKQSGIPNSTFGCFDDGRRMIMIVEGEVWYNATDKEQTLRAVFGIRVKQCCVRNDRRMSYSHYITVADARARC
mmetsp:Transcript_29906/g.62997  ORF Transcript_29906/g.62997 Transcript_29906/m.62997 type:complete len:102 (-) Transcript_29906:684-989(-)